MIAIQREWLAYRASLSFRVTLDKIVCTASYSHIATMRVLTDDVNLVEYEMKACASFSQSAATVCLRCATCILGLLSLHHHNSETDHSNVIHFCCLRI